MILTREGTRRDALIRVDRQLMGSDRVANHHVLLQRHFISKWALYQSCLALVI